LRRSTSFATCVLERSAQTTSPLYQIGWHVGFHHRCATKHFVSYYPF
jgi:hypothetical protein